MTEVHDMLNAKEQHRQQQQQRRPQKNSKKATVYSMADIPIAIQKLSKLGGGFRVVKVGKSDMIVSVPTELDQDHMEIMTLAQEEGQGCVTHDDVQQKLRWSKDRTERALTLLLQEGMAWKDDYHGISFYWFPSVWKEQQGVTPW